MILFGLLITFCFVIIIGANVCLVLRLVEEVYQIGETLEGLKAKLRESEGTLQNLVRTKASLEQDLNIKNNSLFIDKETCLGMRKSLPMLPRLAIY